MNIDFENVTNRLILNFDNAYDADRLRLLDLLVRINPESNYRTMFDKIGGDIDVQRCGTPCLYYETSKDWGLYAFILLLIR